MDSDTLTKFLVAIPQNPDFKARAESILAGPEADRPEALATLAIEAGTPITAAEFSELLSAPLANENELAESTLETITGGSIGDVWNDFLNLFSRNSSDSTKPRRRMLIR